MSKSKKRVNRKSLLLIILVISIAATGLSYLKTSNGQQIYCYPSGTPTGHLDDLGSENTFQALHGFPKAYYKSAVPKECETGFSILKSANNNALFGADHDVGSINNAKSPKAAQLSGSSLAYDFVFWFMASASIATLTVIIRQNK